MDFPIDIHIQDEKSFEDFVLKYKSQIQFILQKHNPDKDIIEQLKRELMIQNEHNEELKNCIQLDKLKSGTHSMYSGEWGENIIKLLLEETFGNLFLIDNNKKNRMMDLRLINKLNSYVIGVECKVKKKITMTDIDKFKRDKSKNKFKGCIMISTDGEIPRLALDENSFAIKNNELYIYSKDMTYIKVAISCFIKYIEDTIDETILHFIIDKIKVLSDQWEQLKKNMRSFDDTILDLLKLAGLERKNGHIYFITKAKCKSSKCPY